MKTLTAAILTLCLAAAPAWAQATPAAPPPAATPPAAAAPVATPSLTKDVKPRMKEVRAQCKTETEGSGLKGDARRQAMASCMMKQRPDKAAAIQCRMDPQLKGMERTARKAAVQACVAKTKG